MNHTKVKLEQIYRKNLIFLEIDLKIYKKIDILPC